MFTWWFLLYLGNPKITLILFFIGKIYHFFFFFFFFGYPLEVFGSYRFQVAKDLRLSCSVILTCMHISTWTRSPVKLVRLRAPLPVLPTTSFWFSRSRGDTPVCISTKLSGDMDALIQGPYFENYWSHSNSSLPDWKTGPAKLTHHVSGWTKTNKTLDFQMLRSEPLLGHHNSPLWF